MTEDDEFQILEESLQRKTDWEMKIKAWNASRSLNAALIVNMTPVEIYEKAFKEGYRAANESKRRGE